MTGLPSGALLVALETSGRVGSVALGRAGEVLEGVVLEGESRFAARLVPALDRVLERAGVRRADVQGVVVGSGPGSFTGVRIAAAMAKGLVHALGLPLWAVSSLEAAAVAERVAWEPEGRRPRSSVRRRPPPPPPRSPEEPVKDPGEGEGRYVLFDARADRVYAACYRIRADGIDVVRPPRATRVGAVLAEPRQQGVLFVGDGAFRHRADIVAAGGSVLPRPAGVPHAGGLLHVLGLRRGLAPVEDPRSWQPDYLRTSGAERARR